MNNAIQLESNEPDWFTSRGILWQDKKEYDKAIADYSEAIRLDPENGIAYGNRGDAWADTGEYDKAISDYDLALKFTDSTEKAAGLGDSEVTGSDSIAMVSVRALILYCRGLIWSDLGDYDKAIMDFEQAIRLDPGYPDPLNGLAWLRATCPIDEYRNGQKAVEYARRACELTSWKNSNDLDTLAAAYAELGDFEKAVVWQQKGISVAPGGDRAAFEGRLMLYRDKKPYRQPTPQ